MLCESSKKTATKNDTSVLILVLMEDALRVAEKCLLCQSGRSLNPCSNGRCSAREVAALFTKALTVLILVLMEDALRVLYFLRH